jgi:hypothetical protein
LSEERIEDAVREPLLVFGVFDTREKKSRSVNEMEDHYLHAACRR